MLSIFAAVDIIAWICTRIARLYRRLDSSSSNRASMSRKSYPPAYREGN